MEQEISEKERARDAALAFAIEASGERVRTAEDIISDAEKFYAFLTKMD